MIKWLKLGQLQNNTHNKYYFRLKSLLYVFALWFISSCSGDKSIVSLKPSSRPTYPYSPVITPFELLHKKYFTTDNGLPNNTITGILQTDEGYLWLASYNGLARYDGKTFQNINSQSENPISSDIVTLVDKNTDGAFLAQTHHYSLVIRQNNIQTYKTPQSPNRRLIMEYILRTNKGQLVMVEDSLLLVL